MSKNSFALLAEIEEDSTESVEETSETKDKTKSKRRVSFTEETKEINKEDKAPWKLYLLKSLHLSEFARLKGKNIMSFEQSRKDGKLLVLIEPSYAKSNMSKTNLREGDVEWELTGETPEVFTLNVKAQETSKTVKNVKNLLNSLIKPLNLVKGYYSIKQSKTKNNTLITIKFSSLDKTTRHTVIDILANTTLS